MKKSLTLIALAISAAMTMPAMASDVSSYLNRKTDKEFDAIIQKAYASDSGRNDVYEDIQNSVTDLTSAQDVSNANELLINVTSMVFPQFAGYWDNVASWGNVPIYQNHDLYDMDRISLPTGIKMTQTPVSIPDAKERHAFVDGAKVSTTPYGSTDYLMQNGNPGIGPDGMPIQICRFFKSKYAPYVEISYSDAKALYPILRGLTYSQACLSPSLTTTYWKSRRGDFYDNFGSPKRPLNTIDRF